MAKQIQDMPLKTGIDGNEDILIQDNGVTKRIKSNELINGGGDGDGNAEVIEARGEYDVLNDRLNAIEKDIDQSVLEIPDNITSKINELEPLTISSVNIIDPELPNCLYNYAVDVTTGEPYTNEYTNGLIATDYIRIISNTEYYRNFKGHLAFYDADKSFIMGIRQNDTTYGDIITTPENTAYVRLTLNGATDPNTLMFVDYQYYKGDQYNKSEHIPYEPVVLINGEYLHIEKNSMDTNVNITHRLGEEVGVNKFNNKDIEMDVAISAVTGATYSFVGLFATGWIPCKENTTYSRNDTTHLAFYDVDKRYISGINSSERLTTFVTPNGCCYIRTCSSTANLNLLMIVEGETVPSVYLPYEAFLTFNDELVDTPIPDKLYEISDRISIDCGINKFNKNDKDVMYDSAVNSSNGRVTTQTGIFTTGWIPCKENTYYTRTTNPHIAFYDKDKIYISGVNNSETKKTVLTPEGCCYLRACSSTSGIDTYMIVEGEDYPAIYHPFETMLLIDGQSQTIKESMIVNGWSKKKWCSYGDSITASNGWQPTVTGALGFGEHYLRGIGGTTFHEKGSVAWIDEEGNYLARPDNGGTQPEGSIEIQSSMCNNERITKTIPTDVDLVVVMGGTNDFGNTELGDLSYPYDDNTFKGSVALTVERIQAHVPDAIIVLVSPVSGRVGEDDEGNTIPAIGGNGLTTEDYAKAIEEVAHYLSIPFIDVYGKCGINHLNRDKYLSDIVHPNNDGYVKKMAPVIVGGLKLIDPLN